MTKQEFINWAKLRGWEQDKFRHLHKTWNDKEYRFKVQATSVRYEVKIHHEATEYSLASNSWLRLRSAYYKDLSISPEGKLLGLH